MSATISISKLDDEDRFSVIVYSRESLDVVLEESIRVDPFTSSIVEFYKSIETSKRYVSRTLLEGTRISPLPGFPVIINDCNLEPFSYHLTFVEFVLRLIKKYELDMGEIVSVVTCFELFPHCLYYFGVSAILFLLNISHGDMNRNCGVSFGYQLGNMMMHFFNRVRYLNDSSKSHSLPPTRFHCYTKLNKLRTLPTFPIWEERCNHKLHTLLMFNARHWVTKDVKTMNSAYLSLIKTLDPFAPNCGNLILQHEVGILSSIGFLPHWVFGHASIDYNGKPMSHFKAIHPSLCVSSEAKKQSTLVTLAAALATDSSHHISLRDVENIICKAFRACVGTDSIPKIGRFKDIVFPGQTVFRFTSNGFTMMNESGEDIDYNGQFIKKWPCMGSLLDMKMVSSQYLETHSYSLDKEYCMGMRPTIVFMKMNNPIEFEFELTQLSYGNKQTDAMAEDVAQKAIFSN
jgi:hypothetical protein